MEDRLDRLDAIEAIRSLKAAYFRCIDLQDWDAFAGLFTDDVEVDVGDDMEAAGRGRAAGQIHGRDAFVAGAVRALRGVRSVHHGHMPEIEVTGPDTANATWAMDDVLVWRDGRVQEGAGHYYEHYRKVEGRWRIASMQLRRLTVRSELADRQAIDDLITRYATAIDTRQWDLLDSVFAPDAVVDYRAAGGIAGTWEEFKIWVSKVLRMYEVTQHLVPNRDIRLAGDEAFGRSSFVNPNRLTVAGEPWLFTCGGTYYDHFVRTPAGWRIARRVEDTVWWDNPLPGLAPVPPGLPAGVDVPGGVI